MKPGRIATTRAWRAARRARWPVVAGAVLAAGVLLASLLSGVLGNRLWPRAEAEAERLRREADAALQAGRLTAADGSGARERYEAAIAIDPDRAELRAGLGRVAQAALARAADAAADGRFVDAHRDLALARSLSAPRARIDAVAEDLRRREAAGAGLDALLAEADAARAAGRLHGGDDAALPRYARILALQPRHRQALEGRDDALSTLLQQAQAKLARGDLVAGAALVNAAAGYDAGHSDLPDARAALSRAVEAVRRRADADLRGGRLARAADGYRVLRDSGAANAAAEAGLRAVAAAHAQRAARAAHDFAFDRARTELASAKALAADAPEVRQAEADLARAQRTRADLGPKPPSADTLRRVGRLLLEYEVAGARGDWLTPPGDSAFDKLRAARALAPDDAGVRHASERMRPRVEACFETALRDNALQRARVCLDARIVLEGEHRGIATARTRLAERWVAMGEQRLRDGDIDGAAAARDAARALDAKTDGLADLSERLHAAASAER
ncbi:MAG: hypothetical protein JF600_08390 [Xanthomonadales bacterium]|nr:hypothetical protein [Xanthomonadales bacterium]